MFMVVIATFEWESFRLLPRMPKSDAFILVSVTLITVFTNLATAVLLGVLLAALTYVWKSSKHIYCEAVQDVPRGTRMYRLHGQLFFGSVSKFKTLLNPPTEPDTVVLNLEHARILDYSGMEALEVTFITAKKVPFNAETHAMEGFGLSKRRCCELLGLNRSLPPENYMHSMGTEFVCLSHSQQF